MSRCERSSTDLLLRAPRAPALRLALAGALAALMSVAPAVFAQAAPEERGTEAAAEEDAPAGAEGEPAKDPLLAKVDEYIEIQDLWREEENWRLEVPPPPALRFDDSKKYYWLLETSVGSLRIEFYPDVAPNHVSNAIYLSRLGFYDGLAFHRIVPKTLAQGGCPLGNGKAGPAYRFDGEFSKSKRSKHSGFGILSAANVGKPGSDGSQFFITFKRLPNLDGKHTVYGRVVMNDRARKVMRELSGAGTPKGKPRREVQILSARVEVVPSGGAAAARRASE